MESLYSMKARMAPPESIASVLWRRGSESKKANAAKADNIKVLKDTNLWKDEQILRSIEKRRSSYMTTMNVTGLSEC